MGVGRASDGAHGARSVYRGRGAAVSRAAARVQPASVNAVQLAQADVEPGAVERERSCLLAGSDPGERAEVDDRLLDGPELQRPVPAGGIGPVGRVQLVGEVAQGGDPGSDEVRRRQRRRVVERGRHPAAAPVAHDHDRADAQGENRELERRAGGMAPRVGLVDRHQRGDVADDEQLARAGVEDRLRPGPRVGAGDDHRATGSDRPPRGGGIARAPPGSVSRGTGGSRRAGRRGGRVRARGIVRAPATGYRRPDGKRGRDS